MSVGVVNKQTGDRIPTAGMPAIDDALDLTSVNPVQNDIITAALANKQDKTDNALQTTDKTIVGAINEHEGDIDSLKSGLTNYQVQNDLNLEVPQRKNALPTFIFKDRNTAGTWSGNTYTLNNVSFECQVNSYGYITSIKVNGTASASTNFFISYWDLVSSDFNNHILTGCPSNGGSGKYMLVFGLTDSPYTAFYDYGSGVTISGYDSTAGARCYIAVANGATLNNEMFYPMARPATITDPTFAPYIPSVESRIEAVESGLTNLQNRRHVYNISTADAELNTSYKIDLPSGYNRANTIITGINFYKYSTLYSEMYVAKDNDLDCTVMINSSDKLLYNLRGSSTVGADTYLRVMIERID